MRWLPFFILAYFALGVQLGAGYDLSYRGAPPNFLLIVVVFIAGNAPRDSGLVASFLLGLLTDLISPQPLGLYALSYGLAGLLVAGSRQVAYSDHPLTHFTLTLGVGLLTAIILYVHALVRPLGAPLTLPSGEVLPPLPTSGGGFFLSAIYTAFLAIPLLWLLAKLKPVFGFRSQRQRF